MRLTFEQITSQRTKRLCSFEFTFSVRKHSYIVTVIMVVLEVQFKTEPVLSVILSIDLQVHTVLISFFLFLHPQSEATMPQKLNEIFN